MRISRPRSIILLLLFLFNVSISPISLFIPDSALLESVQEPAHEQDKNPRYEYETERVASSQYVSNTKSMGLQDPVVFTLAIEDEIYELLSTLTVTLDSLAWKTFEEHTVTVDYHINDIDTDPSNDAYTQTLQVHVTEVKLDLDLADIYIEVPQDIYLGEGDTFSYTFHITYDETDVDHLSDPSIAGICDVHVSLYAYVKIRHGEVESDYDDFIDWDLDGGEQIQISVIRSATLGRAMVLPASGYEALEGFDDSGFIWTEISIEDILRDVTVTLDSSTTPAPVELEGGLWYYTVRVDDPSALQKEQVTLYFYYPPEDLPTGVSSDELVLYKYGDDGWQVYDTIHLDYSFVIFDVPLTMEESYFVIGPRPALTTNLPSTTSSPETSPKTTPPPETNPETSTPSLPAFAPGFELLPAITTILIVLYLARRKK